MHVHMYLYVYVGGVVIDMFGGVGGVEGAMLPVLAGYVVGIFGGVEWGDFLCG